MADYLVITRGAHWLQQASTWVGDPDDPRADPPPEPVVFESAAMSFRSAPRADAPLVVSAACELMSGGTVAQFTLTAEQTEALTVGQLWADVAATVSGFRIPITPILLVLVREAMTA